MTSSIIIFKTVIAIIENGSWAPTSGKQMRTELEENKNNTFINEQIFA